MTTLGEKLNSLPEERRQRIEALADELRDEERHEALVRKLEAKLQDAEHRAWDSLARYKFMMFGYWAGVWIHLNRLVDPPKPNPFLAAVKLARTKRAAATADTEEATS